MLNVIAARLRQGHRTMKFPAGPPPELPDRFRGRPTIDAAAKCPNGCRACAEACPTGAINLAGTMHVDLGKCLFCTDCAEACPAKTLTYSSDYRLAIRHREDLILEQNEKPSLATALSAKILKLFGRSLKLRQVSAGGCNACEADVNVLGTIGWDLGRFGIQFVAAPRHADGLLITGPVTRNMELALKKTYDAVAEPKIVIAAGTCAISGGPFLDHDQACNGAEAVVPIDLYIPGCPPHPLTILDGLLRLLGRLDHGRIE